MDKRIMSISASAVSAISKYHKIRNGILHLINSMKSYLLNIRVSNTYLKLVEREESEAGLIITDTYSKRPLFDFGIYSKVIVKMIKNSYPNFCIGVHGEWGMGKTTFMASIKKQLEDDTNNENIITVWFDAWKYENENQFALIPLLKTINYSIKDEKDEKKKKLKDSLREAAIFTLDLSSGVVSSIIGHYAGKEAGDLSKEGLEKVADKLIPELRKLRELSDLDSNGIFYNGIKRIQDAIDEIRENNPQFKLVVFIDDLDRCSENKVLEILESMKIFLSLNGIVYVLGISYDRIIELVAKIYGSERSEEYLKKFIQIPIFLSEWNVGEIEKLIDDLLESKMIHDDYQHIIRDYKKDISTIVQENPRELKRFLNNLIITYESYKLLEDTVEKKEIFLQQLLLVQILKSRWKDLYTGISNTSGKILQTLDKLPQNDTERADLLKDDSSISPQLRNLFRKYNTDEKLWEFLEKNYQTLKDMHWDTFRRVTNFVSEYYEDPNIRALSLLKSGDIGKFNNERGESGKFKKLDLSASDLSWSDLESANLRKSALRNANFEGAKLYSVSFSGSDLTDVNLSRAKLLFTSFTLANLTGANFSNVNSEMPYQEYISYDADYDIDLSKSILSKANFSGAKLRDAIIINPQSFDGMIVNDETDLSNAIIDEQGVVEYLKQYTQKVPAPIKSKEELRQIFKKRGFEQKRIDFLISLSKRPWRIPGTSLTGTVLE